MKEYFVARVEDVPDGARVAVRVGRRIIALFRIGDEFYALPNRCAHKGGPLCDGDLVRDRKVIRCPWHLWDWSLTTGRLEAYPQRRMPPVQVRVTDGEVRLYTHEDAAADDTDPTPPTGVAP